MTLPQTLDEFTQTSMSALLVDHLAGNRISSVNVEPHGSPGQVADVFTINVAYDKPSSLPRRFIAKVSASSQSARELGITFGLYERETQFYRRFLNPGISTPQCYFTSFDDESQAHLILLEDLAPAESPSWGCSLGQVKNAIEAIATFH